MNGYISDLQWRYSTKKFTPNKKVSKVDLEEIVEAFRLSASSFGLQPWKLFIVTDAEVKKELRAHSWDQEQIENNSHLLVFAKPSTVDDSYVETYIQQHATTQEIEENSLTGLKMTLNGFVNNTPKESLDAWAREQVFIALGNVLSFLAYKKIDSCAVGGFSKEQYDKILGLTEKGYDSVVVLPIGYRDEDDKYINKKKVRFETENIVEYL